MRSGRAEAQPVRGGSVRLEARKQRRRDSREGKHRRTVITEAEFLARRESVERTMVVRDREGITQIGVLEDGILVEHYVTQAGSTSLIGNVYLGRVQNVLPSMEAAFIDIGRGRNGVLYAGEVNWDLLGVPNGDSRRIENVLKSGDTVLVQVSKDPVGQKGARLTSMVSLPGRYVVYVPNSGTTGISRKLPENERNRLKNVLRAVLPEDGGVIVRTAAEGASEDELSRDVTRLLAQWDDIQAKSKTASAPALLYAEPDMTIKVVRDIFNEDVKQLKVSGLDAYEMLEQYIGWVAPDLLPRLEKWVETEDIFTSHRVDEQLAKALDRKVFLPSGGSLASLGAAALFLAAAYFLLIQAMRAGDMSVVAPFRYSGLIFALLIGHVVWGEVPNLLTWLGIVLLVGAGLAILHSERRRHQAAHQAMSEAPATD
ncbi:MAG: hypothetical protein EB027_05000 [Actinobacteria bacterium]|nr:hypothetical protein [Actinomycetota bacterium]